MNIFVANIDSEHDFTAVDEPVLSKERFDDVYLLSSFQKNISVFNLHEKQYLYNLSIDNKEMACSRQSKHKFFVGTFCDTLFMFLYEPKSKKLVPGSEMRTHESIISIAILTDELIICGQSNGYVDTITCRPSKKNVGEFRMDNVSSKFCNNLGYINCIQVCNRMVGANEGAKQDNVFDLALACETGLYFGTISGVTFELSEAEHYYSGMTVSQVIEISPGIVMAAIFETQGLQIIRRANKRKYMVMGEENDLINCSDIMRLPEYNYDQFPYIIARSKHNLSLVNVRTRVVYSLIAETKPNFDNEFSAVTPNGRIATGGSISVIYSSTKQDAPTDTIKTLTLKNQFLSGIKHFSHA